MGTYWKRVAATLIIVPATLGVCARASAQTAKVQLPTVQTAAVDELLVEKQSDVVLRKIVLDMLRVMDSQGTRLNNLEGRVDAHDERLVAVENELATLNRLLKSEGERILSKASTPVASRNTPAPAPTPTPTRAVVATFPTTSQRAGSRLVAIDGAMFVEPSDNGAPAPVVMVGTICPHCVRTGTVSGIAGGRFGVYFQQCFGPSGRYLMVLDR